MIPGTLHEPPHWRAIAVEQCRSVGLHVRVVGAFLLAMFVLYGVLAVYVARLTHETNLIRGGHSTVDFGYSPPASITMVLMAFLLPVAMWIEEGPHRREYHWSMPVDRAAHAFSRTLAGWLCLLVATVVWLLLILAIDAITQRIVGFTSTRRVIYDGWTLLVPFTAVTIAYLLASAAAIGARSPIVWIGGPPLLYLLALVVLDSFGYREAAKSMGVVFSGEYGATAALAGTILGDHGPSLRRWLGAAALWGAASVALVYAMSRRRSETT